MALRIRLSGTELAKVRFAFSPVYETVMALAALDRPGMHAVHLPWAAWARPRLRGVDHLELLRALLVRDDFKPAFLMPPPDTRLPGLDDELRRVRATPATRARTQTVKLTSPAARRFADDPRGGLRLVTQALRDVHDRIVAPHWDRMVRVLEADVVFRARLLAERGLAGLFAGLHHDVAWQSGELIVHPGRTPDITVNLHGHGLVLCPSVFCWPRVTAATAPLTSGTLRYPARGVAALWEEPTAAPRALAELIGRTRAAILVRLATPATTSELASAIGVTAGAISQHLNVLRAAGLVSTHRDVGTVLHLRTERAAALT